ncbi:MAG: FtsX-like permease family protein [Candidatus Poribacteria bacterium]|nr:FtsX-like permease family protein [Candidatus Poribacteria bacterium]
MRRFFGRSFKYFWQIHLTVALCTAVATGVLAGALIVGDSVRGSLRNLTTERLGTIQHALLADHFFQPDLLDRQDKVPAVLLNGTIVAPQTQTRASKVNILGVTENFFTFWDAKTAPNLNKAAGQPFNAIVINEALQSELNAQVGDTLLVNIPQIAEIHPEFILGERDASEAIQSLRLIVSDTVPSENVGRFSLRAHQSLPLNAFIALPVLQKALGQEGKINALFTKETTPISPDELALTLEALELNIQEHETHFDLQSQEYLLKPIFSETALTVASRHRIPTFPTLTYLANTISSNGKTVPYSTIIALPTDNGTFAELLEQHITAADGLAYVEVYQQEVERLKPEISEEHKELDEELEKIKEEMDALAKTGSKLGKTEYKQRLDEIDIALTEIENARKAHRDQRDPNEIVLNAWTAADLGVKVGDGINITYYRVGIDEAYITETASFLLKGILPIEGIAADRGIIPTFPGIHDTADMSEWESPFPIDYAIIRDKDEAYWDEYGATPKAFISLETGKQLWQNRFGDLTSIRMTAAPDTDVHKTRTLFETEFLKEIQPEAVGFQFLSLQADGLQASAGATDFGMLFGSLSAFIIIAVALLVGMLFRIGVEQRSREIGILQAIGYPLVKVRRRFLYEGGIIAGIGSLIGCLLAVGYAQLMIFGLQTWWLPAIGTPFMELHASPWSLLSGVLISLAVVMISIRLTVHKLGRTSAVSLLAGGTDFVDATTGKPKIRKRGYLPFLLALMGGIGVGILVGHPIVRLLGVALVVIGVGWTLFDRWLKSQNVPEQLSRVRFAIRNAARQPGRSTTCVTTISIACCIIVAVGANRHDAPPKTEYAFVAESALPLHHSLNTQDGRFELGFSESASELLSASEIIPFRVLPGEDVSCLNLYQPQKPQILGASDAMLDEFPWRKLKREVSKVGRVLAIGDEKSLRWILHHDPGEDFLVQDEFGQVLRLELETVVNSLFQSQLIISESNFTKYFPSQSGYQFFLIKTPPALRDETAQILEKTLGDYGFDLTSAAARLASYRAVENTYISTFQSLGGLGVLLGTFGLALVFFRNIIERRRELATLRAFGFQRRLLSRMLFIESCFLLAIGMFIGIVAGLAAILASQGHLPSFPWFSLTITLLFIFGFGIIANAVAVAVALRSPLLSTLKSE